MKKYLVAGQQFTLNALVVRIGQSGTIVDLQPDWTGTEEYCGKGGIGQFVDNERYTYDLFIESITGRLWYDDERGY